VSERDHPNIETQNCKKALSSAAAVKCDTPDGSAENAQGPAGSAEKQWDRKSL
jgi:hypothetical protein